MYLPLIRRPFILLMLLASCIVLAPGLHAQWSEQSLENRILWENVLQSEGISISVGEWPGSKFSGFRSETVFSVPFKNLIQMVKDIGSYHEWMPDCDESRLLAQSRENSFIYYVSMKSPWPLEDRYWVNQLEIHPDPENNSTLIEYRSVDGYLPEIKNMVRVRNHYALWRLTPIGENKVHSIWYAHSDPGGIIPSWAVRQTYDQIILKTTRNMIRQVQLIQK